MQLHSQKMKHFKSVYIFAAYNYSYTLKLSSGLLWEYKISTLWEPWRFKSVNDTSLFSILLLHERRLESIFYINLLFCVILMFLEIQVSEISLYKN